MIPKNKMNSELNSRGNEDNTRKEESSLVHQRTKRSLSEERNVVSSPIYAVIRIRGKININKKGRNQMKSVGLEKNHSMVILPKDSLHLIKKMSDYVTWGEISKELSDKFKGEKIIKLSSPKKGFKAIKMVYPKGDLGYRGEKINELIERMM